MAIFEFSITLQDAYTRVTTRRGQLEAASFPAAQLVVSDLIVDLAAITEAEILRSTTSQEVIVTDTVTAGANLDEGLTFVFEKTDTEKAVVKVPAPVNSIINSDGSVNLADPLVVAWADNYIGGPIYISDVELATVLLSGRLDR